MDSYVVLIESHLSCHHEAVCLVWHCDLKLWDFAQALNCVTAGHAIHKV